MNPTERFEPFPNGLKGKRGRGWTVLPDEGVGAHCVPTKKELWVPLGGTCPDCGFGHDHAIRRHEMAHARWTPTRGHQKIQAIIDTGTPVNPHVTQTVEDCRIEGLLLLNGIITDPALCQTEDAKRKFIFQAEHWTTEQRLCFLLATINSNRADLLLVYSALTAHCSSELATLLYGLASEAQQKLRRKPTFDTTIEVSVWLTDMLATIVAKKEASIQRKAEREAKKREAEKAAARKIEEANKARNEVGKRKANKGVPQKDDDIAFGASGGPKKGSHSIWGQMEIIYPLLPHRLPGRLLSRQYPSDEGTYVRSMYRYVTDGKIFGRKIPKPGGAILLDASGSMHWNEKTLYAILEHFPAATIAAYSGNGVNGELHILAEDGRVCTQEHLENFSLGGNEVDGPALEWLGTFDDPLIWVSDGHVIAPSGSYSQAFLERDMYIIKNDIHWVNTNEHVPTPYLPTTTAIMASPRYHKGTGFGDELITTITDIMRHGGALHVS